VRLAAHLATLVTLAVSLGAWSSCKDSSASGTSGQPSAAPGAEPKDVTLPGIDTSAMTPRERREFSGLVTELLAPCPTVPVPVAQCVLDKRACGECTQASKFIAHAVRQGSPASDIERAYKQRYDPAGIKTLPLAGSPSRGPDDAPVTVVEFADFECPHCRLAMPMVDAVLAAHPDKVRLVYKFVVLSMHVHADPAARAAWAAGQQGKFWEMEHLLFDRQEHLEQADLERYAQILKLDVDKFKTDMESGAAKDRLFQDRKLEDQLELAGTPTIYVNGRELELEADESLEERVAGELGVAPAASASAAPSGSAPPAPAPSASAKPH
jgi:protein-disulfide isomerase